MNVVERVYTGLLRHFGVDATEVSIASVTFLGLEPIEVMRIPSEGVAHYATIGGSRYPMTDPGDVHADPVRGPRAELVLSLKSGVGANSGLVRSMGVLVAAPAVEGVILRADALIDLGEPLWRKAPFAAVLLGESDIDEVVLPEPADPVRYFRAIPITATEAAWVRVRGAEALRTAWEEAGIDTADPYRGVAAL